MPDLQLYVEPERTRQDAVTDWIMRGCAAVFFLMVGIEKLSSDPAGPWVGIFAAIGFGQWFRYVTGWLQVGGALLILVPRSATIGAALLASTMLGAIVVHVALGQPSAGIIPGGFLMGLVAILWKQRSMAG